MMRRAGAVLREKRGMALLLVLCLFALLTAFGASILFASSSAVMSATRTFSYEQANQSARSVCELVKSEVIKPTEQESSLREYFNTLTAGQSVPLSITLPEGMGEVVGEENGKLESKVEMLNSNYALVQVTATVKESRSTLRMGFYKVESTELVPGENPSDEPIEVKTFIWTFSGYLPDTND